MKKSTWTLFGADHFINDIIDAIESQNGKLTHVILNQEIGEERMNLIPKDVIIQPIKSFKPQTDNYFFGFVNPNKKPILDLLKKTNITFSNLIHTFSYVPRNTCLGQGVFIGAGVVIGPSVEIGSFNYLKRSSSIGHHVVIGNYNQINPGATICSRCYIGDSNFFGAGSTLINKRIVADNIIVGAGAVVVNDLIDSGAYVGVPAKKLKK